MIYCFKHPTQRGYRLAHKMNVCFCCCSFIDTKHLHPTPKTAPLQKQKIVEAPTQQRCVLTNAIWKNVCLSEMSCGDLFGSLYPNTQTGLESLSTCIRMRVCCFCVGITTECYAGKKDHPERPYCVVTGVEKG
mmetsp:Transcript_9977/g.12228  ORF Transcript_9977/g.12228 Transcript_9977/m.12228 type:complete len:133 (+) Transcript_9977:1090-1488(+)